jgi:hypothetical protein
MRKRKKKIIETKPRGKVGKPTVFTEQVIKDIEDVLKVGGTVEEACSHAGITDRSYYYNVKVNVPLAIRVEKAKHFADIAAKHVVVNKIVKEKDDLNARWWLEKRQFKNELQTPMTQYNQFNFGDASQELVDRFTKFLKSEPTATIEK